MKEKSYLLRIPLPLYTLARVVAAKEDVTLKDLIITSMEKMLEDYKVSDFVPTLNLKRKED